MMGLQIGNRIRELRVAFDEAIEIIDSERRSFGGQFRDISRNGFGIFCIEELCVGEVIEIRDHRSCSTGRIVWADGHKAGGLFIEAAPLLH